MSKSRKISKQAGKERRADHRPDDHEAGVGRGRKVRWLIIGGISIIFVVVLLALMLMPKVPKAPPPRDGTDEQATDTGANDLALRDESFEVARQLVADFPDNAYPLGLMGTVHNQYGHSGEAEEWWRKCLEKDPTRSDIYEVLAVALLRKGENKKVIELFEHAQEVDPNLPGVHRRYGEALLELGRLDEALAALEREMKISPNQSETYLILGRVHLQREEYEEAVNAYRRSIELRPGDSRSYYGLATASVRLGQSEKAREYMETFSELRAVEDEASTSRRMATDVMNPASKIVAETLVDAGRMYARNRRFAKAEECWERAALHDPKNTACRIQLVELYRVTDREEEALELCEELRTIDPKNPSFHLSSGLLFAKLKRFDEAEKTLRTAVALAPEYVTGYRSLADVLLRGNRKLSEAKTLAERVVEMEPTGGNYALLSRACYQLQDRSGALAAMKRAIELEPDNDEYQNIYERLQRGE